MNQDASIWDIEGYTENSVSLGLSQKGGKENSSNTLQSCRQVYCYLDVVEINLTSCYCLVVFKTAYSKQLGCCYINIDDQKCNQYYLNIKDEQGGLSAEIDEIPLIFLLKLLSFRKSNLNKVKPQLKSLERFEIVCFCFSVHGL